MSDSHESNREPCGDCRDGPDPDGSDAPSVGLTATGIGALVEADEPCIFCGYNLRGLSRDGRCPECGRAVMETTSLTRRWVFDARGTQALAGSLLLGSSPVGFLASILVFIAGTALAPAAPMLSLVAVAVLVGAFLTWLLGVMLLLRVVGRVPPLSCRRLVLARVCLGHMIACAAWGGISACTPPTAVGGWLNWLLLSAPFAACVLHLILDMELARLIERAPRGSAPEYVSLLHVCLWIALVALITASLCAVAKACLGSGFIGEEALGIVLFLMVLTSVLAGLLAGGTMVLTTWKFWMDVRRIRYLQRLRVKGTMEAVQARRG
jgi:hypothetical protein